MTPVSSTSFDLENTTIVVTGAAGFIASALIAHVLQKTKATRIIGVDNLDPYYSVDVKHQRIRTLINNKRFTFKELAFASSPMKELLQQIQGPLVFVHTAAKVGFRTGESDPEGYLTTNTLEVGTLLSYLQDLSTLKHCIFFSSSSVYGDSPQLPFQEDQPLNITAARSLYGITKLSLELLVRRFHLVSGVPTTVVRPFNVYGPNGRPDMLPMKILNSALTNSTLEVFGSNQTNKRDWTYIDDCVSLLWNIIQQPRDFEVVNVGRGMTLGIEEVIAIAKQILLEQHNFTLHTTSKETVPFDGRVTLADITKAATMYNYAPQFTFEQGFKKTAEHFFNQK